MNARLESLYAHLSVHATEDREHEAAIELLLLVMLADKHITSDEMDEIRAISEDSGWESDTFSFEQYVGPAMAKARAAMSEGSVEALLDSIDERITSTVLRASLYAAARDVAGVDHDIDAPEHALLGLVAARFD